MNVVAVGLAPSGASSCSRLKARMSDTDTSSWWAIQASVRPWRTQVRIWLSWGFRERRAKGAHTTKTTRFALAVCGGPGLLKWSIRTSLGREAPMLVLTRKSNQSIMIGDDIEVSVLAIMGEKVRIGIEAPALGARVPQGGLPRDPAGRDRRDREGGRVGSSPA